MALQHVLPTSKNPKVISRVGDLLLTCKGTIGEIYVNDIGDVHIARQIMAIRNEHGLNIQFLKFTLHRFLSCISDAAKGIIPDITRDDVLNLPIPIPHLAEQRRIVAAIEAAFAQLGAVAGSLD